VQVLSVIHGENVRAGVFGEVIEERQHELEEWSLAWEDPLPRPLDDYGAVLVFGGAMHADQDDRHPWLREENFFLQRLLNLHTPVLGVCLGAQLLAKAAGAEVYPVSRPEIGWTTVELTEEAADDAVFGKLPRRFDAFQWHYYTHDLPAGAVEVARNELCTQAFRLGDFAWGVQFHAEVTEPQITEWVEDDERELPTPAGEMLSQTRERVAGWNEFGRQLCSSFLEVAQRVGTPA
jgi:GMP synthase-like glutamine amidotransferase